MSGLRIIYLVLAVLGAIVPMSHFLPYMAETGSGLSGLVTAWKADGATTGMYYDLLIAAIALNVWILGETYVRKDWWVLVCIPATWAIGVSCALPLFLFLRTRPVT
jgi:hypothetical protein